MFDSADLIHVYSRAQALADGTLMDASALASEAGFRIPVAVTAVAWSDCVEWDAEDERSDASQSETGRLWDVLSVAHSVAQGHGDDNMLSFQVNRIPRRGQAIRPTVTLVMVIGPGDDQEPVITIGFAEDF